MPRLTIISLLFATALAAQAQQVTLASPSAMQFTDAAYGVTFSYPAQWSFGVNGSFYTPAAITSPENPPRGVVFFKDDGFTPYPKTSLTGAEFVYTTRKADSIADCSSMALKAGGSTLQQETINNITYASTKIENAGMCHQAHEQVYTAYRNQTCYLFDLAVHTLCPGVKDNTRAITSSELAQVRASLEKILSSVEIKHVKKD